MNENVMENFFTLLLLFLLLSGFTFRGDSASELEYELNSLIRSFSSNATGDDCEDYFRELNQLKERIYQAKRDNTEDEQQALNRLDKKARNFYEFAAILTRCPNTSNELEVTSFNSLLNEAGLNPILVKRNGCAAIYRIKCRGSIDPLHLHSF
jgi:hypothetical protein